LAVADVRRSTPPLVTCGFDGEPFVKTWHAGGGVLLFAHTLLLVNPPAGKLNDCAEAACPKEIARINAATPLEAQHTPLRMVSISVQLLFQLLSQEDTGRTAALSTSSKEVQRLNYKKNEWTRNLGLALGEDPHKKTSKRFCVPLLGMSSEKPV